MTQRRSIELGSESIGKPFDGRRLETLDDIPREIADRRLHSEFGEHISPEKSEILRVHPDRIEKPDEFRESARQVGLESTDGVLGWATDIETPAHVLKGDVPTEIATLIHEDLHRLTHPETRQEMTRKPALRDLYEGITEYLSERAVDGLHGHQSGQCYPEEAKAAARLAEDVGESGLRKYFFQHEMSEELERAIERIANHL